jgi:hypothetical protein
MSTTREIISWSTIFKIKINVNLLSTNLIKVKIKMMILQMSSNYQTRMLLFRQIWTTIYMIYLICKSNRTYIQQHRYSKYKYMKKKLIDEQKFAFFSTKFLQFLKIISFEMKSIKQMNSFLSIMSSITIWFYDFKKSIVQKKNMTSFFKSERLKSF